MRVSTKLRREVLPIFDAKLTVVIQLQEALDGSPFRVPSLCSRAVSVIVDFDHHLDLTACRRIFPRAHSIRVDAWWPLVDEENHFYFDNDVAGILRGEDDAEYMDDLIGVINKVDERGPFHELATFEVANSAAFDHSSCALTLIFSPSIDWVKHQTTWYSLHDVYVRTSLHFGDQY